MLSYPVRLVETPEGKVRVVILDVPEAVAEAATETEALFQARFALEHSLGNYRLHGREIPQPSAIPDAPTVSTDKFSAAPPDEQDDDAGERDIAAAAPAAPGGGRY